MDLANLGNWSEKGQLMQMGQVFQHLYGMNMPMLFKTSVAFLGFLLLAAFFHYNQFMSHRMVVNQQSRPTNLPNLWVSSKTSFERPEWIELLWDKPRDICGIQILFDSSLQFHFGQSWQGYAENTIPTIVKEYAILATSADGQELVVANAE